MKTLDIVFTSDTHGNIFPIDYAVNKPINSGLLNIAGKVQKHENMLVLDGGDSLQGTPLVSYYLSHSKEYDFHPVAEAFNAMGLDYFTLGNHDFNFGYDKIKDYLEAMNGTCVCANVEDLGHELKLVKSEIVTLANGLRVGITGAVTDWVNVWESKSNLTKFQITEPFAALEKELSSMKDKCDITICIYHGGYEEDLKDGHLLSDTTENIACRIGKNLNFDILLTGHQHMAVERCVFGNTVSVQPPSTAKIYCTLKAITDDENKILNVETAFENSEGTPEVKAYEKLLPMEEKVQKWLDIPIGELEEEILPEGKLEAALYGSKIAALFNAVELEYAKDADFACSSLFNDPLGLKKEITVRDIYSIYRFANTIDIKKLTGQVIKDSLERCASYFELEDGKPVISRTFLEPKIEHYNYDFYAGLDYEFDLRKEKGSRVVRLKRLDNGEDISMEKEYTVVMSNYRSTGTGGYPGIGSSPIVYSSTDEMPDLLIDYVKKHTPLKEVMNYRFKVIY
ncbi:bifunctional metallophosphatase/5'-nucleotidase [Butyrivibrio sp. NC3005]|uniref:bifunctional metallophosphatase/5'-nucleotidase n=1 Tax=Butyrivibrio sp. NC3005 TaxID=1280685 RepID=UPI000402813C|nr:bifunctional UDP-sugar hydrolase/5'-nucleotidase [Butyrivibrio sp. NC3005]